MSTEQKIVLGDPFAMISGADFREQQLTVAVDCDCGKPFALDLLNGSIKGCPHCGQRFTHALLVCPEDDDDAITDLIEHLLTEASADEIDEEPGADENNSDPHNPNPSENAPIPPATTP